jgi:hypothetical protein
MRSTLADKIHDGRFLRLIDGLLRAGYLEDWRYHATLSGCPQGGIVSPVLSNIYLDRLDQHIEQTLLPAHNQGARRTPYRPYMRLWQRASRLEQRGDREAGLALRKQMKTMPSRDPDDPGYRRLRYCRYADDWLLGFTGPRQEAEQIKVEVGRFLHEELKLELSPTKTLITHGRTHAARFLGYEIVTLHADDKHDQRGHRSINAAIGLKVPADVVRAKCTPYLHHGKPIRRTERIVDTDFSIVTQFQAEFRGVAEYYRLAFNRHRLGRLKYVMERSLTKTLARKYRIRVAQVFRTERVDHRSVVRSGSLCCAWPGRIRRGGTAGSRAGWSASATMSGPAPSDASSPQPGSGRPHAAWTPGGGPFSARRRKVCWPSTSSTWTPCCCAGCTYWWRWGSAHGGCICSG